MTENAKNGQAADVAAPSDREKKEESVKAKKAQSGQVAAVTQAIPVVSDSGADGFLTPDDFIGDEWVGKIYSAPKRLPLTVKTYCFHNLDGKGHPTGVNDQRVYTYLTHTQHIFVCGGIPYIYRNGCYHADQRGTVIKSLIRDCCLEQYVKSTTNERIFKLFLQDYHLEKTPDDLNKYNGIPYINFSNCMYNAKNRRTYPHDPRAMSVNQIPWEYDPSADPGPGNEIEKFLKNAIPDETDREMLLEYIGLCCTTDVDQQKMLIITGDGGTGKSTVINLIQRLVGKQNTSNVAMSKLQENFQAVRMMGKLLNSCADLEIDALDDVTMIKKLVGEDAISDSFKGKDIISFDNYAKLLFSTNELPLVRNEKTAGFYRRLLILVMNEKPDRQDHTLLKRLTEQIPYLIHLAMDALYKMYHRGYIIESQSSRNAIIQLRQDSDSIEAFLIECCERTGHSKDRVLTTEMYEQYEQYCDENGRTKHQKNGFKKALRNKGILEKKSNSKYFFLGVLLKPEGVDENGFMIMPEGEAPPF